MENTSVGINDDGNGCTYQGCTTAIMVVTSFRVTPARAKMIQKFDCDIALLDRPRQQRASSMGSIHMWEFYDYACYFSYYNLRKPILYYRKHAIY